MKDVNRILVVSRSTKSCQKAVHYGVSLARRYGAKLFVVHVMHNPFRLEGWNFGITSLRMEYERLQQKFREDIDHILEAEKTKGLVIQAVMKTGSRSDETIKMVKEENIDLLIMLAHEEGHIEHFLFGHDNEELIRKMPCSIMLVKKESDHAAQ
ncbi:MAG: universal stress protein [Deltaproteobacteria bacterium]|jgi:nucleotide-binding universal stress UspA family protein|nr:universal stress protein [Deltaproteobacteria bacterium]